LVDLDGDGRTDMLSGSWPGELFVFKRKPNGAFAAPEKLKSGLLSALNVGKASAVAAADWDGDGDIDLIVGNIDGQVWLIENEGTKQKPALVRKAPLEVKHVAITVDGGDAGPCVADWDGDGKLDLILGSGSGSVAWYRNVGTATKPELAAAETLVEKAPSPWEGKADLTRSCVRTKPAVADWNGDGQPDLLVGDFVSVGKTPENRELHGWVWVYLQKGTVTAKAEGLTR
jgi:hypothetical protein